MRIIITVESGMVVDCHYHAQSPYEEPPEVLVVDLDGECVGEGVTVESIMPDSIFNAEQQIRDLVL
jgi:hypothetical protein